MFGALCRVGEFSNIENLSVSKIKAMLDVNLLSVIVSAKVVLPHLKKIDNGKLILIGSEAGLKGGKKDPSIRLQNLVCVVLLNQSGGNSEE